MKHTLRNTVPKLSNLIPRNIRSSALSASTNLTWIFWQIEVVCTLMLLQHSDIFLSMQYPTQRNWTNWYNLIAVNMHLTWCWLSGKIMKIKRYSCPENELIPANSHAGSRLRRPISHAWLKNVSCCHLVWHNFQKYVNSDPCKERKPCVKRLNDNTFRAISDFCSEKHWERARVYKHPKTWTGTSDVFGRLWTSSQDFGLFRKWSCRLQKSQYSQDKNLPPISQKKLAGIWTVLTDDCVKSS